MTESPFLDLSPAHERILFRGVAMDAAYEPAADEYQRARSSCVLFDRSDRGLLSARGEDRRSWLHNMLTNAVKSLDDGAGNYAFACDVRGRVQFDVNVLARPDALWLDLDRSTAEAARRHLEKFLITERVTLADECAPFARLGCAGPATRDVAVAAGVTNFAALPALASVTLGDVQTWLLRHDFCGLPAFELVMPREHAADWWRRLAAAGAVPAGLRTRELLRIEAGIPAWGADLDDTVIPAETGQIERGISFDKGCYLGQEVIERMRSLGSPARRLVRLRIAAGPEAVSNALLTARPALLTARPALLTARPALQTAPPTTQTTSPGPPLALRSNGAEVGRVTSLARHPLRGDWIGLGYVKASHLASRGSSVTLDDPDVAVEIVEVLRA
ncbi:MAG: Aminomethyltransferase [Phycisphaerae bacterium]|nr:Aminomethyltransferase [Phycisphaerae bacterium]